MWSARKAAVAAEAEAETRAVEVEIVARQQAELAEKTDEEILTELDLQDPDTLVAGDDFTAFMKTAVPDHLRRRALRRLWLSDPVLANLDNLLDYGDDFLAESKMGGVIKTTYQVGKGMLKHVEEMEAQAKAKAEAECVSEDVTKDAETAESENVIHLDVQQDTDHGADQGGADQGGDEIKDVAAHESIIGDENQHEVEMETETLEPVVMRRMRFGFGQ